VLVQVKFPDAIEKHAVVIHPDAMQICTAAEFPPTLKKVLEPPCAAPVGVCVSHDISQLAALGVKTTNFVCLRKLGQTVSANESGCSLKALCDRFLDVTVDKSLATSDWTRKPLPKRLMQRAALDAKLGTDSFDAAHPLANQVNASLSPSGPDNLFCHNRAHW
jgi:hypothetical protein